MALAALLADFIAPYDPFILNAEMTFQTPTLTYLLGTDEFGRDLLSRIIYGTRISLYIGLTASIVGTASGALQGLGGA